ncbi:MAG: DUF2059 domain-containing protein [Alphaproteobacteria bacterium]|nr:DUF2059 domain-containing protein [Alphaproteobacteria bacterium]
MRLFILLMVMFVLPFGVIAQGLDDDSFEARQELARKMQDIRPARKQVDDAVEQFVSSLPANEQEIYKTALQKILNYKALERISIDAYADTFTEKELIAMVEYYSKPEARSASDKTSQYAQKVYPEIIRMLDKAMMKIKTGGLSH